MNRVVFVHGTGVRQDSYYRSLDTIVKAVKATRTVSEVVSCRWGDDHGAKLHCDGKSIPDYATTRAVGGADVETEARVLWLLLYEDPLFELRLLASAPVAPLANPFGANPGGIELMNLLPSYHPRPVTGEKLEEAGVSDLFRQSVQIVSRSRDCHDALKGAPDALSEYRAAVARALVAETILLQRQELGESSLASNPALRDHLVSAIIEDLGGSERALSGWVLRQVAGLARWTGASSFLQRKRGAITDPSYPAVADILLYQARGDEIRKFIRGVLENPAGENSKSPDPVDSVIILAHSLGGVACVDILQEHAIPNIRLLITLGSQAPFFYEINALPNLPFQSKLRADFPEWLNIYDPQDLLAYVGQDVFPGQVTDVPVDNRVAFPYSHTSYFENPQVWNIIGPRLD